MPRGILYKFIFSIVLMLCFVSGFKGHVRHMGSTYRQFVKSYGRECVRLYSSADMDVDDVVASIKAVGDRIREMKAAKAEKANIEDAVDELQSLKQKYEKIAGESFDPPKAKTDSKSKQQQQQQQKQKKPEVKSEVKSDFITPQGEDYSAWYNDVIFAADMVDQSPVRGCMVIKPWGMAIWDLLRADLDERIRNSGANNAYFPLFIPKSFLSKEAEHVDGFAKECAVVTHHRLCSAEVNGKTELIPDPDAVLEEPLVVRPTSEVVIWDMFGKWISSYRDLPLKINQWANVVRWELRTRPFLRSAEFLWQEGHTAHASKADAVSCAQEMLNVYADCAESMLGIPCVKGVKSPSERFAGADDTYTIEALMQNGWALQSGTSHFLGQNFARAFNVDFQTATGDRDLVWATSWGVSTRLIGALVMTHSDDKGLVLPPPVAPKQVVVVVIPDTKNILGVPEGAEDGSITRAKEICTHLKKLGIRVQLDDRDNMRPGAKYFEWERKGVPIRIEVGPRDVREGHVMIAMRHSEGKEKMACVPEDMHTFAVGIRDKLDSMHKDLLTNAQNRLEMKTFRPTSYAEMKEMVFAANEGEISERDMSKAGMYLVPWKCDADNEEAVKTDCKATIRCYPFEFNKQPPAEGVKCVYSGDQATHMAIFARAY
jgi:prolyl-tRNA synthetase